MTDHALDLATRVSRQEREIRSFRLGLCLLVLLLLLSMGRAMLGSHTTPVLSLHVMLIVLCVVGLLQGVRKLRGKGAHLSKLRTELEGAAPQG